MTDSDARDGDDRELVRRGYDELGDAYHERRTPSEQSLAVLEDLLDDLADDARLLDAGCGQGQPVLERSASVAAAGIDISRGQLEGAAASAPAADLVQGDLLTLPFGADTFDAATAFHSLIHVPGEDHQTVIDELASVLRPGGELLLTEGTGPWSGTNEDWLDAGAAMTWDIVGVEATVEQLIDAGFEVVDRWELREEMEEEDGSWALLRARLVD